MQDREFNYINVIPLVDIMLVLLTIVLTTATFVARGDIPLDLPEVKEAKVKTQLVPTRISLKRSGEIFLNAKPVSFKDLEKFLKRKSQSSPVEVWSDKGAKVENLVKVLELLNRLDFKDVSLAVVKNES